MAEIITLLFFGAYIYFGDNANRYLKYHLLDVRAEVYTDTQQYIVSRIIWAALLGWATIPLSILHRLVKGGN